MSPRISPSPTVSDRPSTATTPPNRLVSPRVSTIGPFPAYRSNLLLVTDTSLASTPKLPRRAPRLMEELPRAELGAVDELVLDEHALRGQVGDPGRDVFRPRLARQQAAVE